MRRAANVDTRSKYGARKTVIDGVTFDSKREAERYAELKILLACSEIEDLCIQPEYLLQATVTICAGPKPKTLRKIVYRADFSYYEIATRLRVVEDVKGHKTEAYKIKAKLFQAKYPDIDFREVR